MAQSHPVTQLDLNSGSLVPESVIFTYCAVYIDQKVEQINEQQIHCVCFRHLSGLLGDKRRPQLLSHFLSPKMFLLNIKIGLPTL